MKVIVIPTSLSDKPYLAEVEGYHLRTWYSIIGCRCIDVVEIQYSDKDSIDCIVDDEGMINGSPVNQYWARAYKKGFCYNPLFGITLITMTNTDNGETIDLDIPRIKEELINHYGFTKEELNNV